MFHYRANSGLPLTPDPAEGVDGWVVECGHVLEKVSIVPGSVDSTDVLPPPPPRILIY